VRWPSRTVAPAEMESYIVNITFWRTTMIDLGRVSEETQSNKPSGGEVTFTDGQA
jgi:hypothetical protein